MISRLKQSVRSQLFTGVEIVGRRVGYPTAPLHYSKLMSFFHLKDLYDQIDAVEGDVAECGVAYGGSLVALCALAQQEGKGRRVYGFDSFEGFPEPSPEDDSYRHPKKGDFREASIGRVREVVRKAEVQEPVLVKGFLEDTLPTFRQPLAFLHLDVDLYSSYKVALEELFDQVVPGGIVAFDEYLDPKWPGATQAIDEVLAGRHQIRKARHLEKYYIVKSGD